MIVRQYAPCSLGRSIICLGKQGEINALRVEFDVSAWMAMYPDATVKLMHFAPDRPQDNPVIPTLGVEGTLRVWIVGEEDTAGAGNGVIELLLIDERTGSTIKSATGYTTVLRSPSAGIEAQEAEAGYVRYDVDQSALLTDEQKAVARKNIGASTGDGPGSGGILKETDPTVPSWAKQPSKPTYTASEVGARPDTWTPSANEVGARPETWMPSASEVGADAAGTASGAVAAHNTSGAAHADLRALIDGLTNRLNALADSDDTTLDQLSEIVAYIKSNKALIDAVTTGKVSVSDIVDNLTTNASGKVLSAAQGVALKAMIDGIVIPTALPNPQPITINGQRYDGSEAVTVTVSSEGGGTPVEIDDTLTQSGQAADAKAVGDQLSALNKAIDALGGEAVYNVKDYGAAGDGATDDQTAIQEAVNDAYANGGGIVYAPKGVYILKSPILWETGVSMRGDGIGQTILKTVSDTAVLGFSAIHYDSSRYGTGNLFKGCTFSDFEIDGSGLQVSEVSWRGKGIFLIGMENCIVRDILVRETAATGIGIDALRNVIISNVTCINCGRAWVKTVSEANVGCAGIGIGTNMIDNEYFVITGCMTKGCGNMGIFLEDQTLASPMRAQYSVIANNIVLDGRNVGIGVRGTANMKISDNIVRGNVYGIEFSRTNKKIVVSDNMICENSYGILDNSVSDDSVDIVGNKIEDNNISGVAYVNTTTMGDGEKNAVVLRGNRIRNNGKGMTISGEIAEIAIIDNYFDNNTEHGIFAESGASLPDAYVLRNIFRRNGVNYAGLIEAASGDVNIDLEVGKLTGIMLNKDAANVDIGRTVTLTASPIPSDAVLSGLEWVSDNTGVATVENGVVTGVAEGACIITASSDGYSAQCRVTVAASSSSEFTISLTDVQTDNGYYDSDGVWVDDDSNFTTSEFYETMGSDVVYAEKRFPVIVAFDAQKAFTHREVKYSAMYLWDEDAYVKFKRSSTEQFAETVHFASTIWESPEINNGIYINTSGIESSGTDQATTKEMFAVDSDSTYLLCCDFASANINATLRVIEYDSDGIFLTRTIGLNRIETRFTTGSTTKYIRIGYGTYSGDNITNSDETVAKMSAATVLVKLSAGS